MNFEEFKLALKHVEKLLYRRQSTTSFYLSVNTGILAVIGLLLKDSPLSGRWLAALGNQPVPAGRRSACIRCSNKLP